jgi:rod shape-determining protein MreB
VFSNTVYVRVGRNQFRVKHIESGADTTVVASTPFTTTRLLIGQFVAAEQSLKGALKQLATGRLFAVSPSVVMHPMEMVEEGLSEIEERTLREVAIGAGAGKAVVWVGRELSDSEVKEKVSAK